MFRPFALILGALALTGCTEATVPDKAGGPEKAGGSGKVGMANPASVFCEEQGGTLELRPVGLSAAEGVAGYCHLPDGRVVEEWAYYHEHNKPAPPVMEPEPAKP